MLIKLISFGFKAGEIPKADIVLDCRVITNPFHIPALGGKTGDDTAVQDFVYGSSGETIDAFKTLIMKGISTLPARRQGEDPFARPITIAFGCAHGVHRSKACKNIIANWLPSQLTQPFKVEVK